LFQRIGTEGIRYAFGPDIWVETLLKRAVLDDITAVADVRFINESAELRKNGAKIIRLENANNPSKVDSKHQSEAEWSQAEYDYVIRHDGKTLSTLLTSVDEICYGLGVTPVTLT
jgi:predicted fused transcriptional regulator/phosphomethylpyrimidine kinase